MERDSRQDLILAGLLALGLHLALLAWSLPGGWVAPEPGAPVNPLVVRLVALRPAAEVWPQKGIRAKVTGSAARGRRPTIRRKAGIIRHTRLAPTQSRPSRQSPPEKTRKKTCPSAAAPAPAALRRPPEPAAASAAPPASGLGRTLPSQGSAPGGPAFVEAQPPRYGYRQEPRYPRLAVLRGYEGTVLLRVHILRSGRVAAVEIKESSGYGILDRTARDAVRSWRFSPAVIGGKAVASWVLVPITFRLR